MAYYVILIFRNGARASKSCVGGTGVCNDFSINEVILDFSLYEQERNDDLSQSDKTYFDIIGDIGSA